MKHMIVTLSVFCIVLIMMAGCQESDSTLVQRARLVGNENLKLKDQLQEKDQQIAQLKEDIEKLEAEKVQIIQESGDTNIKIMRIVAETEQRNQALTDENAKLKEELEKLKAQ